MNARDILIQRGKADIWLTPAERADSILAALASAGMVVVPVEPTKAMRWAGEVAWEACPPWNDQPGAVADDCATVYRAMIAASTGGHR